MVSTLRYLKNVFLKNVVRTKTGIEHNFYLFLEPYSVSESGEKTVRYQPERYGT